VVLADPSAALATTADGGVTWSVRRSPAANPRRCEPDDPGFLAAATTRKATRLARPTR
jgi:hypothetical protein